MRAFDSSKSAARQQPLSLRRCGASHANHRVKLPPRRSFRRARNYHDGQWFAFRPPRLDLLMPQFADRDADGFEPFPGRRVGENATGQFVAAQLGVRPDDVLNRAFRTSVSAGRPGSTYDTARSSVPPRAGRARATVAPIRICPADAAGQSKDFHGHTRVLKKK